MSEVEEKPDLSTMDMIILACCPVDRSNLPQGPELDNIVITDLYTLDKCRNRNCQFGTDIWVGPRQLAAAKEHEGKAMLFCYVCAMLAQEWMGQVPGSAMELGGGHTREGRPRLG